LGFRAWDLRVDTYGFWSKSLDRETGGCYRGHPAAVALTQLCWGHVV
jgi:hypothetical protein